MSTTGLCVQLIVYFGCVESLVLNRSPSCRVRYVKHLMLSFHLNFFDEEVLWYLNRQNESPILKHDLSIIDLKSSCKASDLIVIFLNNFLLIFFWGVGEGRGSFPLILFLPFSTLLEFQLFFFFFLIGALVDMSEKGREALSCVNIPFNA